MQIRAFKGFRFDPGVVGDAGVCISPPYDVINEAEQQRLYDRSKHNIVRIIRGKAEPGDGETVNVYSRAAGYLKQWIDQGVLKQDAQEAIYAYIQDFEAAGRHYRRDGFVALGKLEPFGPVVRPHEQTLSKPKADRLRLERATGAKLGLVFMLYEDPRMVADEIMEKAARGPALLDMADDDGVRHRLYAVTGRADIDAIARMMADKSVVIADGHHRYETGLATLAERGEAAAWQMMAFVNTCHEGLVVLATHRLVGNVPDFDGKQLITAVKEHFVVERIASDGVPGKKRACGNMMERLRGHFDAGRNAFGIYWGDGAFYVAVLEDASAMDGPGAGRSKAWRGLDVAILHKLVIERLLGVGESQLAAEGFVEYIKDKENAIGDSIRAVDEGRKQVAFFMNPPRISQIREVAEAGEKMPQKSTFFHPKFFTGLVIQRL